jgi:hypothetical protein
MTLSVRALMRMRMRARVLDLTRRSEYVLGVKRGSTLQIASVFCFSCHLEYPPIL